MNGPDPQDFPLPESDVRDIVRLLGRVAATPGNIHEKRCLLMDGLCSLIRATGWAWCRGDNATGRPPRITDRSGKTSSPPRGDSQPPGPSTTSYRRPDPLVLLGNPSSPVLARPEQIGALITCRRKVAEGTSGIGIYREQGEPEFSARETRLARIILDEVPWLHHTTFAPQVIEEGPRLYPRHRAVLDLLCQGLSRKRIAARLKLSENTVHGYVKTIFSHFGVHSQSELINRLARGDGSEPPGN